MLEANPLGPDLHRPIEVIDAKRSRVAWLRSLLLMHRINDIGDAKHPVGNFAAQNSILGRLRLVPRLGIGWRECVAARWTVRVTDRHHLLTLGTLLRRCFTGAIGRRLLNANIVDRPMTLDVPAEVQNQARFLPGMNSQAAADYLIVQTRRHRGAKDNDHIDGRRVKPFRQNVDVAEVLSLAELEPLDDRLPLRFWHRSRQAVNGLASVSELFGNRSGVKNTRTKNQDAFAIASVVQDLGYR